MNIAIDINTLKILTNRLISVTKRKQGKPFVDNEELIKHI